MENDSLKKAFSGETGGLIVCETAQGASLQADLLRLNRHSAAFEVRNPNSVLQLSESLKDFKISFGERVVYSGRAVTTSLINTGRGLICEATLDDAGMQSDFLRGEEGSHQLKAAFETFLKNWGNNYRISPDFKILLADMASYLSDLRVWFEQLELAVRSAANGASAELERQALTELRGPMNFGLNALFEKFEIVAAEVPVEEKPAHLAWVRRLIHPLMLVAPFADRTYHKPLGYAGDYEMVNMILRDPFEGRSMFAKSLNAWFLAQPPAEAHRNRIKYLTEQLVNETLRTTVRGRKARIFNLGCGPALEIQRFIAESELSNHAELTLLDFNDETLAYTTGLLQNLKHRHQRSVGLNIVKRSVAQLLTGRGKSTVTAPTADYDLVYCAGLFDYLPDNYCRQLMNMFYEMLAPGGLLVATNVDAVNPIQGMLDYVLDWNLIYRNGRQLATVAPQKAGADWIKVSADVTSVNIYLEVRKPAS